MNQFLSSNHQQAMPAPVAIEESIAGMKTLLLKKIKRSAYVYRVDCGWRNGWLMKMILA